MNFRFIWVALEGERGGKREGVVGKVRQITARPLLLVWEYYMGVIYIYCVILYT